MTDEDRTKTAGQWFEEGRACFNKPDGIGAVRAMERVINLSPLYCHTDGDTPYFYLGKIHEVEGDMKMAVFHYTRALAINPHDEESLIGRGSCHTVTKAHAQAVADFKKVLEFPDKYRRAPRKHLYYAIAENYKQMQDWENAEKWGKKALSEDPDNYRHQELLKEVTAKIKQHPV